MHQIHQQGGLPIVGEKMILNELDRIYRIYSYNLALLGNTKGSKGYHVCTLINKYVSSNLASWIIQNIVDPFVSTDEWEAIIARRDTGKPKNTETVLA